MGGHQSCSDRDGPFVPTATIDVSPSPPPRVPICPHYVPTPLSSKIKGISETLSPLPPPNNKNHPNSVFLWVFYVRLCKNKPSFNPESPAPPGTGGVPLCSVPEPPRGHRGVLGGSQGGEKEGLELQLLPEEPGEEELS